MSIILLMLACACGILYDPLQRTIIIDHKNASFSTLGVLVPDDTLPMNLKDYYMFGIDGFCGFYRLYTALDFND